MLAGATLAALSMHPLIWGIWAILFIALVLRLGIRAIKMLG